MKAQEVRALLARKSGSIQHTCYQAPQHRDDDLKICVALELLAAMLEREQEASAGMPEKEERKHVDHMNQNEARLEQVAREYVKDYRPSCNNPEEAAQRLLKDHQVRCAHSILKDDLNQPNVHYLEPENRTALEWAYLHLSGDELLHERCRRVLVANTLHILQREESWLVEEPAKKRFRVTYDVKRSGSQDMVVEAENEAEARNLVQSILNKSGASSFDEVKTEFVAAEVYEANEEKGAAK